MVWELVYGGDSLPFCQGQEECFSAGRGDAAGRVAAADHTAGADRETERGGQLAGASPRTPGVFSGKGESIDREGAGAGAGPVPGTRGMLCR